MSASRKLPAELQLKRVAGVIVYDYAHGHGIMVPPRGMRLVLDLGTAIHYGALGARELRRVDRETPGGDNRKRDDTRLINRWSSTMAPGLTTGGSPYASI